MAVSWTRHRFSGGVLALDAANTVVHRGDATRSFDRFADPGEIPRFAAAARSFRTDELGQHDIAVPEMSNVHETVLAIRETTDALFRATVLHGDLHVAALPAFLRACAGGLDGDGDASGKSAAETAASTPFVAALAMSALSLLPQKTYRRIRICPNCNWLFLDRSRNASRLWCDMTVCGNRQKAKRHYRRRKAVAEDFSNG